MAENTRSAEHPTEQAGHSAEWECPEGNSDRETSGSHGQFAIRTARVVNAEDLREAVQGADLTIVQLAPGPFRGQLTHARIGSLGLSAGDFEPDIRARGVMNPDLVTIGMMIESDGEVRQWDFDVVPGDVVVFPRSVEQEGRFTGRSRYVSLTLSESELALHSGGEGAPSEPDFWTRIHRFRASPSVREFVCREIAAKVAHLRQGWVPETPAAVAYLKRSLLEAFMVGAADQQSVKTEDRRSGSKLVRAVEDYIEGLDRLDPVHVSELCVALDVPRRTLHRAFQETLGLGPVEYLRLARLAQVRRLLTSARSSTVNVSQAALEAGFSDLGRFAAYYRRLYGEVPSRTQKFQRWNG